MNTQSLPIPNTSSNSTRLHGGWLLLARFLWLVLVIIAVGLFVEGIPLRSDDLRERYQPKIGTFFISGPSNEILMFPWDGYPATQAGILDGDVLVAVNGKPIQLSRNAPENFMKDLIRIGPAGTPVTLRVRTGNHAPRDYTVFLGGDDAVALARLGLSPEFITAYAIAIEATFALVCIGIALLILLRKSNDWLALLASLTFTVALLGVSANVIAFYDNNPFWRPLMGIWFSLIVFFLLLFACLFPVGRRAPRWTLAVVIAGAVWTLLTILNPNLQITRIPRPDNFLVVLGWLGVGMIVQVYHYRHSNPTQKQQSKWVILGAVVATVGVLGQAASKFWSMPPGLPTVLFDLAGYPLTQLFKLFLPITIAIAILRYHLWDIDIIINRTLVYGTLTASVIGIYVVVVGVLGTTIQGRGNLVVSILATGLVAVLVQPLRDRLQRGVNRMMYGERDDPVTVLSRLGQRLEGTLAPDAVLPSLVETVAQTLKLPYVAIESTTDEQRESSTTIAYGKRPSDVIRLPLIYQSDTIGHLVFAQRASGEALSPMDRHLLENIAHQAAMAVHAVSLTADLQRSRQRLVTAREEERRRLRRDLHDGLGPNLASQGLKLAAVKRLAQDDPASAVPLLEQVMAQNQATVEEVRRLVYGLRPPALDELGLVAAIRDHVAGMDNKSTLQIEVTEPAEGLPLLSAAVEVAAYRIVLEALTNVIRHAQARRCAIRFSHNQNGSNALQIEIADDGIGLPHDLRAGVGLRSMRERAEEVGGSLIVESQSNLTRVSAVLPISEMSIPANRASQRLMENPL
jgi:signal transduction histidine kinase